MPALFRRVLVPHDFSDHATRALQAAAALAAEHRGKIQVLHVIAPFTPVTGLPPVDAAAYVPPPEVIAQARERLEALATRAAGKKVPIACRVVLGDPFTQIMQAARSADSIVMATAGRTGLAHLLIGSVAEKVVRHARVPVLTLRPRSRR